MKWVKNGFELFLLKRASKRLASGSVLLCLGAKMDVWHGSGGNPRWLASKVLSPDCWEPRFKSSYAPSVLPGPWRGDRSTTVKQRV